MRMVCWFLGCRDTHSSLSYIDSCWWVILYFFLHKWRKRKAKKKMSPTKSKWKRVCLHVKLSQRQSITSLKLFAYFIHLGLLSLSHAFHSFLRVESLMHNESMRARPIIMSLQICHCFHANWLHPPYSEDALQPKSKFCLLVLLSIIRFSNFASLSLGI